MNAVVSFEESVKQRLKDMVAGLIPDDRWDAIVRATVQDFEKNDLPKMIKEELTEQYKKSIAAEFAKNEWQSTWANGAHEASPALKQLIVEAAPLVLASMIGGAMQSTLQQFQYNLQQQRVF